MSDIPQIPDDLIEYSPEIIQAKKEGKPIVALESTIITHGMEYPENHKTATKLEETIKAEGAVPATICILHGKIRVGLDKDTLLDISKNKTGFIKCSTRDIPYALMSKKNGSTTVAATMCFVTGGIGGVHYGNDMDISGDLIELSRTPVTVICAGAKSILDVPRTLEFLETYNVPVIGFNCDKFPEFFFANGENDVKVRLNTEKEVAEFIHMTHDKLKQKCGILVAVPVPEEAGCDKTAIKKAISEALEDCKKDNVKGNKITPYLLKKVNDLTGGASCDTNIKLVVNNAVKGARICKELFNIK